MDRGFSPSPGKASSVGARWQGLHYRFAGMIADMRHREWK
ncbi:hypothetical protein V474_21280 [Novosphingobium barchaimii LL02]|uniref:Uncharacterized protein n=1 Tax=Novosphingobium barchaimii LL02 TaxID=1114963 RepID=A0A0J8AI22_9SPHN|nr:hypothetical protein V474_21280 [Novosphingobium barchaimii LL02]